MRVDVHVGLQGSGPLDARNDEASGVAQARPAATTPPVEAVSARDAGAARDTVEISAEAQALLAGGTMPAQDQTELRPDMVERAKRVLQAGLYNDQGVLEKTAEKIAGILSTEA